jgi:hypothetical protein
MYVVEVVSSALVVQRAYRSLEYDYALNMFDIHKKKKWREIRLVRIVNGVKVTLKFVDKSR